MIITIDGPAGAGKSTVARALARRLNMAYLDTGAMYRAITLLAIRQQLDMTDAAALTAAAAGAKLKLSYAAGGELIVELDGEDVSTAIRSEQVSTSSHYIASCGPLREILVQAQRDFAAAHANIVTEGRDQGSVVFPDAELKIYLVATADERARRRYKELNRRGESCDYQQILESIVQRDQRDSSRVASPLKRPDGSTLVETTELTADEVVEKIAAIAQELM